LARNTVWMLGGRGLRRVIQAVYFLLIARALGASEYGAFVGAASLVAIVAPFSSWGMGFILVRKVSRDPHAFAPAWGKALSVTALSAALLLCLVVAIANAVFAGAVPLTALLLVAISDLFAVRIVDLATQVFMAVEVLRKSAEVNVFLSLARTFGAMVLTLGVAKPTASSWAVLYLLTGVLAAAYSFVAVSRTLGFPEFGFRLSWAEFQEGFYFAIGLASQTIYNDADKTMLVRLSGLEAAGIYGAAYRIIDASFAPVASVAYAAYARFFQHGAHGISQSLRFAKSLLRYSVAYGLVTATALAIASPALPTLLGADFAAATIALRWLSPLIFFKSIHYFLANSLTGAGFQRHCAAIQLIMAIINVALNLWLMPAYSWRGAAWASIATDGLLAMTLWYTARALIRRANANPLFIETDTTADLTAETELSTYRLRPAGRRQTL
jgi:O-antigen/teichoic acid export membrane protein